MTTLRKITKNEKDILNNLLVEYLLELLPNDHPQYKFLDRYWLEKDRYPFFIYFESNMVGFVLLNRVHSIPQHPIPYSIAEFYIKPKFRKKGIGKSAAIQCFNRFPGNWEVQIFSNNIAGIHFWRKTIGQFTAHQYKEQEDKQSDRIIQIFKSIGNLNIN